MSPFLPIFLGTQNEGCCFQSERLLYGREPMCKGGTGKQKPRSCRTQELA